MEMTTSLQGTVYRALGTNSDLQGILEQELIYAADCSHSEF
jgi:hypothetical protein